MKRKVIAAVMLVACGWTLVPGFPSGQVESLAQPPDSAAFGVLRGAVRSGGEPLGFANVVVVGTRRGT